MSSWYLVFFAAAIERESSSLICSVTLFGGETLFLIEYFDEYSPGKRYYLSAFAYTSLTAGSAFWWYAG